MKKTNLLRVFAAFFSFAGISSHAELLYGLSGNTLFTFDSASPGTVGGVRAISGLQGGDSLRGIDLRPETGTLYGLGSSLRLYTIDPTSGAASLVSPSTFGNTIGLEYGFDFNPVPDAVRVVNDGAQNFRVSPSGSLLGNDGTLAYAVNDPSFGQDPVVVGVAYANNVGDATTTTLFGIDSSTDAVILIPSPNSGVLNTRGLLGINTTEKVGFDISGLTGTAYASLTKPGESLSGLYRIDVGTGGASLLGNIGFAGPLDGLTAATVPEPSTFALLALGAFGYFAFARNHGNTRRK